MLSVEITLEVQWPARAARDRGRRAGGLGGGRSPRSDAARAQRPDRSGRAPISTSRRRPERPYSSISTSGSALRSGSSEAASRIVNLKDVAAPNGIATIELGRAGPRRCGRRRSSGPRGEPAADGNPSRQGDRQAAPRPRRRGRPRPAPDPVDAADRRRRRPVRAERRDGSDGDREADARSDARRRAATVDRARRRRPLGARSRT